MAYSKTVQAVLKKLNAEDGDRLRVETPKGVFEGILLPRPDASGTEESEGILILKLYNGYNVGLALEGARLEKLEGKTALERFDSWTPPLIAKHRSEEHTSELQSQFQL